jgi:hypothetical protein
MKVSQDLRHVHPLGWFVLTDARHLSLFDLGIFALIRARLWNRGLDPSLRVGLSGS